MRRLALLVLLVAGCEPGQLDTTTVITIEPPIPTAEAGAPDDPIDGGAEADDAGLDRDSARPPPDPSRDLGPDDPCAEVVCGDGAECRAGDCVCLPGFEEAPGGGCRPEDACRDVICPADATCERGECRCDAGFEPAGDDCLPIDPCRDVRCGQGAACRDGACVCQPGFVEQGGACVPAPMTPLELRTQQEVCDHWAQERVAVRPEWVAGDGSACDPGAVPDDAQANSIRRTNLYRWQAGLGPVVLNEGLVPTQQACATVLAAMRRLSHDLTPDMPCYSPEAARGAGSSNLAGGGGLADSVDLYVTDPGAGNAELGHRRWVLNPAMGDTAFGYKNGWSCMYSFSMSQRHEVDFVAWPTPGFMPVQAASGRFHVALYGLAPDRDFRIEAALGEDGAFEPVEFTPLHTGFGRSRAAYRYEPPGGQSIRQIWTAGVVLRIALRGLRNHADVEYTTRFVACR